MLHEQDVKTLLLRELPDLLEHDPQIRESIWRLVTPYFSPRYETDSRFDRMLNEIQRMREESERKWEEQRKADQEAREESKRKWEEQHKADQEAREESKRKWDEQQKLNQEMLAEIKRVDTKIETKMSAIGARWGIDSETSFRNALRGILEEVADVQVLHVNDYDESGEVFGRPDQVELDVVIRNGLLIICEIKSSVTRSDVHIFQNKVRFYERRHQRTAQQKVIITPMIDPRALSCATSLGMDVYHNAEDVILEDGESASTSDEA